MQYRQLGRTGLKVSELCLGTMTFGSNFLNIAVLGQSSANSLVFRSIEAGINFFDTADVYSEGESETILGKALKESALTRDAAVIATKVRGPMSLAARQGSGDLNNVGLSRKHIIAACEASLRRLNTDYIDLYQVHGWDIRTPLEETLRALDDLVRQGKVRYIGASNWALRHLVRAESLADARGWERFASLQAYYSLAGRDIEHELQTYCVETGMGILTWSPLSGGYLTGKFRRDHQAPEDARRSGLDFPPVDPRVFDAVNELERVAKEVGTSIPQVALAWLLTRPAVSAVLIGAKNMTQLEDNLLASEVHLSTEQIDRLSACTQPMKQYPAWMIERQNSGR